MQHHIMYERAQHAPLEVASDPEAFADTYAELCGIIPIDDLVELYVKAFPELPMDYETMRGAAAQRPASWNGVCKTWTHEGVEYALAAAFSDSGHAEWFFYNIKHNDFEHMDRYEKELPAELEHERELRAKLVKRHLAHPIKELTFDELVKGHPALIEEAPCTQRLIEELLAIRLGRKDRARKDTERFRIAQEVNRSALIASTMIDVNGNRAYEDAEFLMIYTYPLGPRDYDPFRDEPDPNVLLATEKVYRELPLWGLNGWNQEEIRAQMFERMRNEKSAP